jgi:hypothetical protein
MATAEQRNHAKSFLKKAEEYLASAEDSLAAKRHAPAAGDAIHAGISSKDAIVTTLTGSTSKGKDHSTAAKELKQALGRRPDATVAERRFGTALREGRRGVWRRARYGRQGRIARPAGSNTQ